MAAEDVEAKQEVEMNTTMLTTKILVKKKFPKLKKTQIKEHRKAPELKEEEEVAEATKLIVEAEEEEVAVKVMATKMRISSMIQMHTRKT